MDLYLNSGKIFRTVVNIGEWIIILCVGIFFPSPRINLWYLNYILGAVIFLMGFLFHHWAHKVNPFAHFQKENVKEIITSGIYSKIRHPIYGGYMLMYVGTFFFLGSVWILIPVFLFSFLFYHSAINEERYLEKKFGDKYQIYKKKVPWRFIPYIF